MASTVKDRRIDIPEGMKTPLIVSALFHIALLVVAITGLPYFKTEHDPLESTAIPIEILPIAELTTTNKPPVKAQPAPEKPPEEKPIQKEKPPTPPKVEAVEPPKEITPPKPKSETKPKPKPVTPPPPQEKLEEAKVEEKPAEEKVAPKPAEKPPEEKPIEESQQQDFSSLLKNLQDSNPIVDQDLPESKTADAPAPSPQAAFSETLTMSEIDALRQQLSRCWSIQAGARYADDLKVDIRLTVSRERRVLSATVVDQWRYSQDSYFRAAADSAIRAVNSPQCETLVLNPDKYEMWKDMEITFDPSEML